MSLDVKELATRAITAHPLYRCLPGGGLRTYAALRYHSANSSREAITAYVRKMRRPATKHFATGMIAARAAFRTADDELVEDLLARIMSRYPARAQPYELRADLRSFQGSHDIALSDAEHARFLDPARTSATARLVRLHYLAGSSEADDVAAAAVGRFPLSTTVLWSAAMACRTGAQYERIATTWRAANQPQTLRTTVRPLATAAARAGRVDEAARLYRDAIALLATSGAAPKVSETRLQGRGAWSAIEDLRDILDTAGVPFFFAAGTALGLVREGRPLDLDGDIDVGIFERDWGRERLVELFNSDSRFDLVLHHPYSRKIALKHRGGSPVDIFRFYEEGGRIWHDAVFVRWFNSPFAVERRTVRGVEIPVPADTDRYLTENYGDWRTPNAAFDAFTDDAPNVEIIWPDYARFHLLRRAYKRLAENDVPGVVHELRLVGEEDLAARIGRARG